MASILGSPAFLARPLAKPQLSCSQTPRSQQPIRSQPEPSAQPSSPPTPPPPPPPPPPKPQQKPKVAAESTDWIASSLTRRFGLGAGLAWVGFLAFGVVSEQIKTRLEVSREQANTRVVEKEEEVVLPNGIRYTELRVGGGASPRPGDLVVIDLQGRVEGSSDAFVDTFGEGKRPLALVMGSRPYTKGMCEGVEYVLRSMKAGGKRRVTVPPVLGFGDDGADLGAGLRIPASATLEFIVQVDKVSIAPS
ncbi:peptidyl-prolyl cis-trans isomerase FKBP17-2, chloroplastic-like [Musa acuminata AAA Group]|uniref:peptidyl-prolyl cis-trans isomerase FKBP17-2, chloroplastic-like n=1 Tax=Musa acuminata AAA Group TaxID=214697 RepID=UPI0031E053E8